MENGIRGASDGICGFSFDMIFQFMQPFDHISNKYIVRSGWKPKGLKRETKGVENVKAYFENCPIIRLYYFVRLYVVISLHIVSW